MGYDDPRKAEVKEILPGEVIVRTSEMEWRPIGEKAYYKLLHLDEVSGRWQGLFRLDKGAIMNPHFHKGAIEGYVITGKMTFRGRLIQTGDYLYEPLGAVHEAATALEDTIMTSQFHGPVEFLDDEGETVAVWDWEWVKREQAGVEQASLSKAAEPVAT
jgi:quercetin dioxygenase-like cupin family protein